MQTVKNNGRFPRCDDISTNQKAVTQFSGLSLGSSGSGLFICYWKTFVYGMARLLLPVEKRHKYTDLSATEAFKTRETKARVEEHCHSLTAHLLFPIAGRKMGWNGADKHSSFMSQTTRSTAVLLSLSIVQTKHSQCQ